MASGNILKRGQQKYLVRIPLGTDSTGKRRTLTKTIHGTKADAEKFIREKLRERDLGTLPVQATECFGPYATQWLTLHRPHLVRQTQKHYTYIVEKLLIPAWGSERLTALTPSRLEQFLFDLREQRGLRSAQYTRMILRQILQRAVRDKILDQNPLEDVHLPHEKAPHFYVLTPPERERFLAVAKAWPHYGPFLITLLMTGLRPSEAVALRWTDYDAGTNTLHVRWTLEKVRGEWTFKDTKTPTSRRVVALPQWMRPMLAEHRASLAEQGLDYWMFPTRQGKPIDRNNFKHREFRKVLKAARLPDTVRLYDLRHTHATMLLEAGVHPRVVADRLGHSSVTMTLQRYSHVLPHVQQMAIASLESLGNSPQIAQNPPSS